jgi:cytoskeletal protein RodZ
MAEEIPDEVVGQPVTNGVGAQLRAAREKLGLTLKEVAAETRIPLRHLEKIEEGDFAALPARTYAVGFSRNYAKLVGLNEDDVVEMVRAELDAQEPRQRPRPTTFEPGDPARVPSRSLAWVSILAVVLVLAGLFVAARTFFAPAAELPSLVDQERAAREAAEASQRAVAARPTLAAPVSGPVVFTALEDGIWVRFSDGSDTQLMQKLMAKGETYAVPVDVEGPQLWTGRPDALAITIGGRAVPKLAEDDMVMKNVPVSAEALLARAPAAPAPGATPAPAAAPVGGMTPAPSPSPTA